MCFLAENEFIWILCINVYVGLRNSLLLITGNVLTISMLEFGS